jgi:hypothetical protein
MSTASHRRRALNPALRHHNRARTQFFNGLLGSRLKTRSGFGRLRAAEAASVGIADPARHPPPASIRGAGARRFHVDSPG